MDDALIEAMARAIGYHMAVSVSRNNQPCMSGDPRDRIPTAYRRIFDDCVQESATASLAAIRKTHAVVPRDEAIDVVASLAAAISIIERTPQARKAAMSDKAFGIMLNDYTKALATGRAMLAASEEQTNGQ